MRVKPTAQAVEPYILQVALPSGVSYVSGRATGLKAAPTVSAGSGGATLVMWSAVNPKKTKGTRTRPMVRAFTVKVRVDQGVAKGAPLAFAGTLYQVNQVTNAGTVCGRSASMTVRAIDGI